MARYDEMGVGYARTRQPDPRIARRILDALADSRSLLNVGAGTGSYEPADIGVVAVEPSATMIAQRAAAAAPAVRASAEALPFSDGSFDAALASLTIHHWHDRARGLAEMRRVARGKVLVFTWDQPVWESFWLLADYLPGMWEVDRRNAVPIDDIVSGLGGGQVLPVPIPHDCVDGFFGAFWRRPEAYLDPAVRSGISGFTFLPEREREEGLRKLESDLQSGAWRERHADLLAVDELDLGYRLIVADAALG